MTEPHADSSPQQREAEFAQHDEQRRLRAFVGAPIDILDGEEGSGLRERRAFQSGAQNGMDLSRTGALDPPEDVVPVPRPTARQSYNIADFGAVNFENENRPQEVVALMRDAMGDVYEVVVDEPPPPDTDQSPMDEAEYAKPNPKLAAAQGDLVHTDDVRRVEMDVIGEGATRLLQVGQARESKAMLGGRVAGEVFMHQNHEQSAQALDDIPAGYEDGPYHSSIAPASLARPLEVTQRGLDHDQARGIGADLGSVAGRGVAREAYGDVSSALGGARKVTLGDADVTTRPVQSASDARAAMVRAHRSRLGPTRGAYELAAQDVLPGLSTAVPAAAWRSGAEAPSSTTGTQANVLAPSVHTAGPGTHVPSATSEVPREHAQSAGAYGVADATRASVPNVPTATDHVHSIPLAPAPPQAAHDASLPDQRHVPQMSEPALAQALRAADPRAPEAEAPGTSLRASVEDARAQMLDAGAPLSSNAAHAGPAVPATSAPARQQVLDAAPPHAPAAHAQRSAVRSAGADAVRAQALQPHAPLPGLHAARGAVRAGAAVVRSQALDSALPMQTRDPSQALRVREAVEEVRHQHLEAAAPSLEHGTVPSGSVPSAPTRQPQQRAQAGPQGHVPDAATSTGAAVAPASRTVLSQKQMPGAAPLPYDASAGHAAHVASAGDAVLPQTLDASGHVVASEADVLHAAARADVEDATGVALPSPQPTAAAATEPGTNVRGGAEPTRQKALDAAAVVTNVLSSGGGVQSAAQGAAHEAVDARAPALDVAAAHAGSGARATQSADARVASMPAQEPANIALRAALPVAHGGDAPAETVRMAHEDAHAEGGVTPLEHVLGAMGVQAAMLPGHVEDAQHVHGTALVDRLDRFMDSMGRFADDFVARDAEMSMRSDAIDLGAIRGTRFDPDASVGMDSSARLVPEGDRDVRAEQNAFPELHFGGRGGLPAL